MKKVEAIYLYWIDANRRMEICERLGLPTHVTLNGKTKVTDMTAELYAKLQELERQDIIRMTLKS